MLSDHFVGNHSLIANLNRSAILRLVKEQGPLSRAEIAKRLNLNPATVSRVVSKLLENQLLLETGLRPSQGGRRGTLLGYNRKAGSVIGLDLNGAYLLGVLADLGGEFTHRIERPASPTRDGEENLGWVYDMVQELLEFEPHVRASLRGIGASCSSVTINPEGIIALSAILGWRNVPLKAILEKRFGYSVTVQNQSDLSALAESVWGVGRHASRLVWLDVGSGIGSGIVIDGRLYQGAHHAAGEIGYIIPDLNALGKTFDTFGCMETIGSCTALLDKARKAAESGTSAALLDRLMQKGTLRSGDVFEAARAGDPLSLRLVEEMADHVALMIVNIVSVLDPDVVVLGAELAQAGDLFIPRITAQIRGVVATMPDLAVSALGTESAIRGAVALALQATEEQFCLAQTTFGELLAV